MGWKLSWISVGNQHIQVTCHWHWNPAEINQIWSSYSLKKLKNVKKNQTNKAKEQERRVLNYQGRRKTKVVSIFLALHDSLPGPVALCRDLDSWFSSYSGMVPALWWTKSSVMDWRGSSLSQWLLQPEPRRLRLRPESPPPGRNRCASAASLHQLCFVRCLARGSSLHHVWLKFAVHV